MNTSQFCFICDSEFDAAGNCSCKNEDGPPVYSQFVVDNLVAENKMLSDKVRSLAKWFDDHYGTPCQQIRNQQEVDELRRSLREKFCPRPCNNRPDDFTVGQCVDAGECGCGSQCAGMTPQVAR